MLVQVNHIPKTLQDAPKTKRITVGIDMGGKSWVANLLFHDSGKQRTMTFKGNGKELECLNELNRWQKGANNVHAIYEAGRYGFTPARVFSHFGIGCTVVPINKIEIVRSGKRVKTDRLDAAVLSQINPNAPDLPSVYIPSVEEETDRGLISEEKRLQKDHQRKNNAILAILVRWWVGTMLESKTHRDASSWQQWIKENRYRDDGKPSLPDSEFWRIENLIEELELVEKQQQRWEQRIRERDNQKRKAAQAKEEIYLVDLLQQFKGIGDRGARILAWKLGNFDRFKNGKCIASFFGLTSVPWNSGTMQRDQGISKTGDRLLRSTLIELAWLWRRWQPDSTLTKKWNEKLNKKGRMRRVAIVAMARQLIVALYRYVVKGEMIEGAVINRAIPSS
jgi:transposase